MASKLGVKGWHKKVWKVCSRYIRLRDAIETTGEPYYFHCVTCKATTDIKEGDAGHFMPSTRKNTQYNEQNIHAQCKYCNNKNWNQGEQYKHGIAIDQMYGEGTAQALTSMSSHSKRFTANELESLYEHYKEKLSELESTYGEMW